VKLSKEKQKECGVPPLSEKEFTKQVLNLAKLCGWRSAHFRAAWTRSGKMVTPVQGDAKGFPDLVLVKGERMIVAELKVGRNKPSPEQIDWLAAFEKLPGVAVRTWKPKDWPSIVALLTRED
jgi:hypothetical protein